MRCSALGRRQRSVDTSFVGVIRAERVVGVFLLLARRKGELKRRCFSWWAAWAVVGQIQGSLGWAWPGPTQLAWAAAPAIVVSSSSAPMPAIASASGREWTSAFWEASRHQPFLSHQRQVPKYLCHHMTWSGLSQHGHHAAQRRRLPRLPLGSVRPHLPWPAMVLILALLDRQAAVD
jgi:hypothetical protein